MVRLPSAVRHAGALLSYLREPVAWSDDDPRLTGHSNSWESRAIAYALANLGFGVTAIDWSDRTAPVDETFEVVMAIDGALPLLSERHGAQRSLLHATGAHPAFQNPAEQRRLDELQARRGVRCVPRRTASDTEGFAAALEAADACSLIGNAWTLSTYPPYLHHKIACVDVSASPLRLIKSSREIEVAGPEFLWFFGSGAVHKGLDRLLEVFARSPDLVLNIVGNVLGEEDFLAAYARELALPNVQLHGVLDPRGRAFGRVARRCFCVVAPSCSEGMSPATASMLQVGLYPVISRETGITLPEGCGKYLGDCSPQDIEVAVRWVAEQGPRRLAQETTVVQRDALRRYSRPAFAATINAYLRGVTG